MSEGGALGDGDGIQNTVPLVGGQKSPGQAPIQASLPWEAPARAPRTVKTRSRRLAGPSVLGRGGGERRGRQQGSRSSPSYRVRAGL